MIAIGWTHFYSEIFSYPVNHPKPTHYSISLYLWFHVYTIAVACSKNSVPIMIPYISCNSICSGLDASPLSFYSVNSTAYKYFLLYLSWSMSLIALAMIMVHWNYERKYNFAWGVYSRWCIFRLCLHEFEK